MVHIVTIYLFLSHPNITSVPIESFLDIDVRKKKLQPYVYSNKIVPVVKKETILKG